MLIDPFLNSDPSLSYASTGIRELSGEHDTIEWLGAVKSLLELADWEVTDRVPSKGTQTIYRFEFPVAFPPVPPVMPAAYPGNPCTDYIRFGTSLGQMEFYPYDPFRYIKPEGCRNRVFYEMGDTPWDTAENLAEAMSDGPIQVTLQGDPDALTFNFYFETKYPYAWEYDITHTPHIGWGSTHLSMGSYTLRSPLYNSGWMSIQLMDRSIGVFGGAGGYYTDDNSVLGSLQPYLIVGGSGTGTYESPVYNLGTGYFMCANPYQVVIWSDGTGQYGSALLASLLKMDPGHMTGANPVLIVGSENNEPTGDYQQLREKQHWENAIGSGYDTQIHMTGYRTRGPNPLGNVRTPTLLARGLRNQGLLTLSGTSFASAPYILLSRDPNGVTAPADQGDYIAGRLWDMIVMTDSTETSLTSTILHNNVKYQLLSSGMRANDLRTSLWLKQTEN